MQAQVSGYAFSESAGTYTAISGTIIHASGWNDPAPVSITIPFSFTFNNTVYTACSVNGNGYITFGATASTAAGFSPISAATGYAGAVSALGLDLVSNSSTVEYATTGTAPNRIFIVQWNNCRRSANNAAGADWNFQIKLFETTNVVQVQYGACAATNATNTINAQIGLRGANNTDYSNRFKNSASSWANTTIAGFANNNTVLTRNTSLPPSGRTFIWTPPLVTNSCDPNGNVIIYSNYDGGVLNINVDQNIPNLKIGVCSYEGVTINISGTFVGNVTAVRYAGYNANNAHCGSPISTTINGVAAAITSVNIYPAATMSDPNGSSNMVCATGCSSGPTGGCNTPGQVAHYFLTHFGGTMRLHQVQYGCWSGTQLVSAGGNCCLVNIVLPVELNYFSAICTENGKAKLSWETSSETNNHFFTVERSDNGIDFYQIARVNGAGTSSQPHQYIYIDQTEIPQFAYYRLRQTDFNGQTEVFPIRALNRSSCNESNELISIFPNPAENTIALQCYSPVETRSQIICSDMIGRVLFSVERQLSEGENVIAIDISELSPGTYTLSIESNAISENRYTRFLKQ